MGSKRFSAPHVILNVQLLVDAGTIVESVPLLTIVEAVLVTVILANTVVSLKTVAVVLMTVGWAVVLTIMEPSEVNVV